MKIILSHDVDHLFLTEHWNDRFIPGLVVKSLRSLLKNDLSFKGFLRRFSHRLHRIPELIEFNSSHNAPANFFFGMAKGLSLSYSYKKAAPVIQSLQKDGHFIGTHGMAYDDKKSMLEEKRRLESILGFEVCGIRNHYLRQSSDNQRFMSELGYHFDSTDRGLFDPVKKDGILSIPISVMDVDVVKPRVSTEAALKATLDKLDEATEKNLKYFVINFHDIYFDSVSYPNFYNWYTELVKECQDRGFEFTDFNAVLQEQQSQKIFEL